MQSFDNILNSKNSYCDKLDLISNHLCSIYDNKLELILECIIKFLGEQYRSIVTERFNELTFVIGFTPSSVREYICSKMNMDKANALGGIKPTTDYKNLLLFYEQVLSKSHSYDDITVIHKYGYLKDSELPFVKRIFSDEENCCSKAGKYFFIFHNLFCSFNDETIIHEIIHGISSDILLLIECDRDKSTETLCKFGIETFMPGLDKRERNIDELLTQTITKRVMNQLHSKGVSIISNGSVNNYESGYDIRLYIVEEFFNGYKKEIIEAMVTHNKNRLMYTVGKYNYFDLVDLINDNWNNPDIDYVKDMLSSVLARMNKHSGIEKGPRVIKPYSKYKHH